MCRAITKVGRTIGFLRIPAVAVLLGVAGLPGFGGDIQLEWNPNGEKELAGYRLYQGLAPRHYTRTNDLGNVTNTTVTTEIPGATHYFAVTAYSTNGLESEFSKEVSHNAPLNGEPIVDLDLAPEPGLEDEPISIPWIGASIPTAWSLLDSPTNGTVRGEVGSLQYVPSSNVAGSDEFRILGIDGTIPLVRIRVSVVVKAVPDSPVAIGAEYASENGEPVEILLDAKDVDGQELTYRVVRPPEFGEISGAPPNLIYTPRAGYEGRDELTFVASDGELESPPALVAVISLPEDETETWVEVERTAEGELMLRWRAVPGRLYGVFYRKSLSTGDWFAVSTRGASETEQVYSWRIRMGPDSPMGFYKIGWEPYDYDGE